MPETSLMQHQDCGCSLKSCSGFGLAQLMLMPDLCWEQHQNESNTMAGFSGQREIRCSHFHLQLAVPCSSHLQHLCKVTAWQFVQNPLMYGNGIDQISKLDDNTSLTKTAFDVDPTADRIPGLSCFPVGCRGHMHPDGGGRISLVTARQGTVLLQVCQLMN